MGTKDIGRMAVSLEEARQALGVSRTLIYRMADDGRLPTIRLGRRRLVPIRKLEEMLAEADASTSGVGDQ